MICFSLAWYFFFWETGFHAGGNDAIALGIIFAFVAIFHSFLATKTLEKVWDEYVLLNSYVAVEDKESFQAEMHKRIPFEIKFLLIALTLVIQGMAMSFPYDTLFWGMVIVIIVAFILGLFWEVAVNLDDPINGIWYKGRVPKDWLAFS